MCGIAGLYTRNGIGNAENIVRAMCDSFIHRGPDGDGYWTAKEYSLSFGHRRLSIIDLSELGKQPMTSKSGRITITYNGEIYNFKELKAELELLGHYFVGSSDTEVIVEAVDEWGVKEATTKLIGMFAFSVWNSSDKTISLVRDRLGIKPLFYAMNDTLFSFASEIQAFAELDQPDLIDKLDLSALEKYFRTQYVSAPNTIYEGIKRLEQGSIATFSCETGALSIDSYWDLIGVANHAQRQQHRGSYNEQVDELELLLKDSVKRRMIADVPLGGFLSGGIDSSLVCALMQSQSSSPVRTFTIGFSEGDYNEAEYAEAIAKHLGTNHEQLYLKPHDLIKYVDRLPEIIDEPFADVSLIPTLAVSKLASEKVTVVLSGDGGDELFVGYRQYQNVPRLHQRLNNIPKPLQKIFGSTIGAFSPSYGRFARLAALLNADSFEYFYESYMSQWQTFSQLLSSRYQRAGSVNDYLEFSLSAEKSESLLSHMMLRDAKYYMADDILQKVDIASMHYSLEARVPLLDHRVFEYAWSMPLAFRRHDGIEKAPLKDILRKYVPEELFERPKHGFGVPISSWLRGPLKEWASDILSEDSIAATGILQYDLVRKIWNEHASGRHDRGAYLWSILCLQQWALKKRIVI